MTRECCLEAERTKPVQALIHTHVTLDHPPLQVCLGGCSLAQADGALLLVGPHYLQLATPTAASPLLGLVLHPPLRFLFYCCISTAGHDVESVPPPLLIYCCGSWCSSSTTDRSIRSFL